MAQAKQARWQKDASLGPVSGRSHLATADKVFDRVRDLEPRPRNDLKPVMLCDDISKDDFFPIDEAEITEALEKLPVKDVSDITHIWLRRPKASEFRNGRIPFAEYFAVEGINLIVFYPWPRSMQIPLAKKPADAILTRYKRWAPMPQSHKAKWLVKWHPEQVQDFYLNHLLKHMIALHIDFHQKNAARKSRGARIELPLQYANQRFFEENLTTW